MSTKKTKDIFDSWAKTQRGINMAQGHSHIVQYFLENTEFSQNDKILDIGMGIGQALWEVHQNIQIPLEQLYGIDYSSEMVKTAQKRLQEDNIAVGSAEKLPWENQFFDKILSIESLYYHQDLDKSLGEAYRVLKNEGPYFCAIEYYADNLGSQVWPEILGLTLHNLTELQWADRFKKAGFQVTTGRIKKANRQELIKNFKPSQYFPELELYENYLEQGALLILGIK